MSTANDKPERSNKADAEEAARDYAWKWFEYHAGQRQAVLRFFLLLAGAISTGYLTALSSTTLRPWSYLFGMMLVILAFLFWRLDVRSALLIKLAEAYLKEDEKKLSALLRTDAVRLAAKSDEIKADEFPAFKWTYSFRQVYRLLFVLVGLFGLLIFVYSPGSPIKGEIGPAAPTPAAVTSNTGFWHCLKLLVGC